MMLAQFTPVGPTELGNWLLVLFGTLSVVALIVAIAVGIKKLFAPVPMSAQPVVQNELDKYVTRMEFNQLKDAVNACATKAEVGAIKDQVAKLDEYTHGWSHRFGSDLQTIMARLAVLQEGATDTKAQALRVAQEVSEHGKRIERAVAFLERLGVPPLPAAPAQAPSPALPPSAPPTS